jgi:hypothetical protein
MMKLRPSEIELRGGWECVANSMKANVVSQRIQTLITAYLIKVGEDESGWNKLFQDPEDKRYWELSYAESEMHGGGAPLLKNLSIEEVSKKYQI